MMKNKHTVLVVDDDELILDLMEHFLKKINIKAILCLNESKAWEQLKNHKNNIHLIILDKRLSNQCGIELAKKIKQHPDYKIIPLLIQTGDINKDDRQLKQEIGIEQYLYKPLDMQKFSRIIKQTLDLQSTQSNNIH